MSRTGFGVTVTADMIGGALAGCSGSSLFTPDWLKQKPSPPPVQTLQFQSEPPGADVRTAQGQMCQTPCSLAVPSESQSVTFAKNGFLPQTVQVRVDEPAEHSLFSKTPAPAFVPNPVRVGAPISSTTARANCECTAAQVGCETGSPPSLQTLLAHFRINDATARGITPPPPPR